VRRVRRAIGRGVLFPLAGWLARAWFRALHRWTRSERHGPLAGWLAQGRPCIVALWHQDVFPLMFDLFRDTPGRRCLFLVSGGFAGELGSHLLGLWGIECVPVSGAGGGPAAVDELARRLRERPGTAFLMADGSRGPAREARWGAVHLARQTGLPLVAARAWGDNLVVLGRTWMRLVLPKPWGRMVVVSSEPLAVSPDADRPALEAARAALQQRLDAAVEEAEARLAAPGQDAHPAAQRATGPRHGGAGR